MDVISNLKQFSTNNNIFHKGFEIGILLKAFDGILEIIGGLLLIFLTPGRLNHFVAWLTQRELSEDSRDVVANFLINLSSTFTISSQYFGVFYLTSHGIIKLILVILLLKKKIWAYPITVLSLILFIVYQLYKYTIHSSTWLIVLTILDIIMIILTFIEYKRIINLRKV